MARTVNKARVERRAGEARPRFEQVLTAENETFLWRIDDYPWARSIWNFHPEFEIHLIRKSTGTVFIGDYIGEFSPGHLTIVGGGLPHNWVSHIRAGETVNSRDLVVQFDPEKLRRFVCNSVVMITRESIKRGPFLPGATNELPFVLANRAGGWRLCSFAKLRSALNADEIFHRDDEPNR